MRKNKTVPEVGQKLTIDGDMISISGRIILEKGTIVTVTEVKMSEGYWSRLCPDIYVHPELLWIKIKEERGCWLANAFVETKEP